MLACPQCLAFILSYFIPYPHPHMFTQHCIQASPTTVELQLQGCHPGYRLEQASNQTSQSCVCDLRNRIIVQCDDFNRYFYARVGIFMNNLIKSLLLYYHQDGYWIGVKNESSLIASTTVPGFLNCTRQGALPGCEIKYDRLEDQCAEGRNGQLKYHLSDWLPHSSW